MKITIECGINNQMKITCIFIHRSYDLIQLGRLIFFIRDKSLCSYQLFNQLFRKQTK